MRRLCAVMIAALFAPVALAEPAAVERFFERHCYASHSGTSPEVGLDLATLPRALLLPLAVEPTPLGLTTDEIQRRSETLRKDRKRLLLERGIDKSTNAVGLLGHLNYGLGGSVVLGVALIYPGLDRLRMSLWAFQWNKGSIEPALASQALAIWGSDNTQLQTGSRLVTMFSAPSFRPAVHEATVWLDPQEALVSDPVSLDPHRLQYVRQAGGHVMEYVGPGIVIDWYEFEGPLTPLWPPESHTRLFDDLPIAALPADATVVPPSRPRGVRQLLYHLPDLHKDLPPTERKPTLETMQSTVSEADAPRLLSAFLPRAFRRPVAAAGKDRPLIWHFPSYHPETGFKTVVPAIGGDDARSQQVRLHAAIRISPWKLIHWFKGDRREHYDLALDPYESFDRCADDPQAVQWLDGQLFATLRVWTPWFPQMRAAVTP